MDLTKSYVYTVGMTDAEIAANLRSRRTAVLSFVDGGRPDAVPVAYALDDGGEVYLRLGDGESRRLDGLDVGEEVSLVVHEDGDGAGDDFWSVSLRGSLVPVDERSVPGGFGPFRVYDEDVERVSLRYVRLRDAERVGRRTCQ